MSTRPIWTGRFDQHHIARLNFDLHSPALQATVTLDGIIDTGFTGFVQIPLTFGASLGLLKPKLPTSSSLLANGTKQPVILAPAQVAVEAETQSGLCQMPVAATCPILIGMDFLRRFDRMLIVSSTVGIQLVPEVRQQLNSN